MSTSLHGVFRSPRPAPFSRSRMGLLAGCALLFTAVSVPAGCAQNAGIEFDPKTQPPLETRITEDEIRIYAGIAVAVDTIAMSGDDPADDGTTVALESSDSLVLGVSPAVTDGVFVIYGVQPGTARMTVYMNNEPAGDIPATVLLQGEVP